MEHVCEYCTIKTNLYTVSVSMQQNCRNLLTITKDRSIVRIYNMLAPVEYYVPVICDGLKVKVFYYTCEKCLEEKIDVLFPKNQETVLEDL